MWSSQKFPQNPKARIFQKIVYDIGILYKEARSGADDIIMRIDKAEDRRKQREYAKAHYDQISLWVKKGQREKFKEQAAFRNMSLSSYIIGLLTHDGECIQAEKDAGPASVSG